MDTANIQLQATGSNIILAVDFLQKTTILITALKIVRFYIEELFGTITVQDLTPLDYLDIQDGEKELFGTLSIITLAPLTELSS